MPHSKDTKDIYVIYNIYPTLNCLIIPHELYLLSFGDDHERFI